MVKLPHKVTKKQKTDKSEDTTDQGSPPNTPPQNDLQQTGMDASMGATAPLISNNNKPIVHSYVSYSYPIYNIDENSTFSASTPKPSTPPQTPVSSTSSSVPSTPTSTTVSTPPSESVNTKANGLESPQGPKAEEENQDINGDGFVDIRGDQDMTELDLDIKQTSAVNRASQTKKPKINLTFLSR